MTDHQDFQLLESFGLIEGTYLVYEEHFNRLSRSAAHFSFSLNTAAVQAALDNLKTRHPSGSWKVRLLVNKDGTFHVEIEEMKRLAKSLAFSLAKEPIDSASPFLYYKTTKREIYDKHQSKRPGVFDTLLWNVNEEITEFTIGNAVAEIGGNLYTPPIECGLLAGTFRSRLLKEGLIQERKIQLSELNSCSSFWLVNSVRGWVPIEPEKRFLL